MKKFSFIALAAAGLLMASCSQEEVVKPGADEGNFTVTVALPADLATRAFGTGLVADNLLYAVYDITEGDYRLVTTGRGNFGFSLRTQVELKLAVGKNYKIAFFAQSGLSEKQTGGNQVYLFDPEAREIVVNYYLMTSDGNLGDAYDCFYNAYETGTVTAGMEGTTIYLYRPVAQINWGTNDYDEVAVKDDNAFGENGQYVATNLKMKAHTRYDFFGGEKGLGDVKGQPQEITMGWQNFAAPTAETFPVEGYQYVAMQYVLAPKASALYNLNLNIDNDNNPNVEFVTNVDVAVTNAPLQANFRTNIYGALLTNPTVFNVVKSEIWDGPDHNVMMPQTQN